MTESIENESIGHEAAEHETPDQHSAEHETPGSGVPVTEVAESDPNADSDAGLAGDMGVSSERKGHVRGVSEQVTYAAVPVHVDPPDGEVPPEQSAFDPRPDVNPASPGAHESDPDSNPRHGV